MKDLLLNSVALDVVGLTLFAVMAYFLLKPVRRKPKVKPLRVVAGVRCWCKAFGVAPDCCYCVSFDPKKSGQDGVK